jgi:hypothetical protein
VGDFIEFWNIADILSNSLIRIKEIMPDERPRINRTYTFQVVPVKITRLYNGSDNHSCFEDIGIDLESKGPLGLFTEPVGAKAVFFREIQPGYEYTWHNVVCREWRKTEVWQRGRSARRGYNWQGSPDTGDRQEALATDICHAAVKCAFAISPAKQYCRYQVSSYHS